MFYVVMILLVGLMAFGYVKHRAEVPWGKPLLTTCVGLIVAWNLAFALFGGESTEALHEEIVNRQMSFERVGAQKLAQHLVDTNAGTKAVVILPLDVVRRPEYLEAVTEGLTLGFGEKIEIVETVEAPVPPQYSDVELGDDNAMDALPPISSWYNAPFMDQVMFDAMGKGCDLIVCLAGLPEDAAKMGFWKAPNRPKVAVLANFPAMVKAHVDAGHVVAAVAYKTTPSTSTEFPSDLDEAFKMRYQLLTTP